MDREMLKISRKTKIFTKTKKKTKDIKFWLLIISSIFNIFLVIALLLFFRKNSILDEAKTSKELYPIISSNNNYNNSYNNSYDNISEKIKILKLITNNNKFKYIGAENCLLKDPDEQLCIYHLLAPKKVVGKNRVLLGIKADGSYVFLDDFDKIKIAYSFGISREIQCDNELAKKGIDGTCMIIQLMVYLIIIQNFIGVKSV